MTELKHKLASQFTSALPFCAALGMTLDDMGESSAVMSMPYDTRIVGDPDTGVVHGGAVAALLDSCCGVAVFLHPDCKMPTATIDLRIDYMRSATPGQRISARAEVYRATRNVAFLRATAWDDDVDTPIASAAGAFTFSQAKSAGVKT